jgi:hypothetical protein
MPVVGAEMSIRNFTQRKESSGLACVCKLDQGNATLMQ